MNDMVMVPIEVYDDQVHLCAGMVLEKLLERMPDDLLSHGDNVSQVLRYTDAMADEISGVYKKLENYASHATRKDGEAGDEDWQNIPVRLNGYNRYVPYGIVERCLLVFSVTAALEGLKELPAVDGDPVEAAMSTWAIALSLCAKELHSVLSSSIKVRGNQLIVLRAGAYLCCGSPYGISRDGYQVRRFSVDDLVEAIRERREEWLPNKFERSLLNLFDVESRHLEERELNESDVREALVGLVKVGVFDEEGGKYMYSF